MNAALLLMTSTFMVGADAPVAAAPAPAACCSDACDPCGKKPCLLDKIKSRLGSRKHHDCCEPAPKCCEKPAPAPKCEPVCDPCAARPNLLDKIKSKLHSRKQKDCCAPACDGCAAPAPIPAPPGTPPKPMDPKKTGSDIPAIPTPGALNVPVIPVTPVSGGKLTGANSPY